MRHVLSALVKNEPGVISRVSGLFRRRGYNIDSFIGSSTHDERFSRLTVVVRGDDIVIAQVINQLEKLEDVISIDDIQAENMVSKVLLFMKVKADIDNRVGIITVANACNARVIEMNTESLILEALETEGKISQMIEIFKPYGIIELVKTGVVAMKR
ncbi:acetolactate synthase small subunit [Anaerovorax odorimutans]|uniref:acetolactate synthase small subunit n=1 Tax=Anaerovorax odorimutans TaxID=109327 RepID=UPI00041F9801|nr:acetolactate synthase small subunit [Anaerovorax odorimutans]